MRGVKISNVERGMLLCAQGSEDISNHFIGSMYLLSRAEGGRSKPLLSKYIQQLFSVTWNVPARVDLSKNFQYFNDQNNLTFALFQCLQMAC